MMIARGEGAGKWGSYFLMNIEFQFYKMQRVMEMDGDDDKVSVFNATLLYT